MTTESAFRAFARSYSTADVQIKGWRHTYALARMEGILMYIAALKRLSGEVDAGAKCQIAFVAFDYVRERYGVRELLSPLCAELVNSIECLARELHEGDWFWALEYEHTRQRELETNSQISSKHHQIQAQ